MAVSVSEQAACLFEVQQAVHLEEVDAVETVSEQQVTRWQSGLPEAVIDALAQEVPVALVYNGLSHVVMLCSPADLVDFAYGFSFTEGIISHAEQIYSVELQARYAEDGQYQGIEVQIALASAQFAGLKQQRRNLTGRTGCGLCGAESLQQVFKQPQLASHGHFVSLSMEAIDGAVSRLQSQQPLQQLTGATHACAVMTSGGELLALREDVGRHNALDKLIGALLRAKQLHALQYSQYILTTSRASYEMVQKVAMAGGKALIAMSAPTALAVNLAKQYDLLLVGFAKPGRCVVYHGSLAKA